MAQRLVVPLPPPKWWWSLMCKLCIYIYTHMCVYTYVICVCANVYSMYMYVYLHMSMYPSPPWMWWRGFGGPWTRDTGPYIYNIYNSWFILIQRWNIYIYTILMYSVCFVFSYRRTIMFIAFFFVFLRTCPGKLQGHHHDVYIRIAPNSGWGTAGSIWGWKNR